MTELELKIEALAQAVKNSAEKEIDAVLNDARKIYLFFREESTPSAPATSAEEGSAII